MKQTALVKKRKSHRILILTFWLFAFVLMISSAIYMRDPKIFLIFIPLLIPITLLGIYNCTWQLYLDQKYIAKRVFFREVKRYSYTQIQKVVKEHFVSEQQTCVIVYFVDGKNIHFRMDCDDAIQAVKMLSKHRTISIK